ncbi:MAG: peptidylprolyl isomerase, partial [Verrucomicrobiales bacterium]|nr:peptidylprolyl isomerase [Verrucomicrobiales bacterium]
SGRYQDSILHRCPVSQLTGVSDFVVQGGGIFVSNRGKTNAILDFVPSFGDIQNEFAVGRRHSNTYGTIAMAKRAGDTNSASSQWFFNLGNNAFLDKPDTNNLFVVFGRVVGGTNVLNQFMGRLYGRGVVNLGGVLSELPVTYFGNRVPEYSELFYTDITLLNVQAQSVAEGGREISWNSISNRVNVVEFADAFPPVWRTLVSTNGDGSTLRVQDPTKDSAARFYRVRVEF